MDRRLIVALLVMLVGCRKYDLESRLRNQDGLISADQYAHYGKEQAEAAAIGREWGRMTGGDTPEALAQKADSAMKYARTFPDVADIVADPLGHRLTIRFASGWRVAVNPVDDGKSGADTPGLTTASKPR